MLDSARDIIFRTDASLDIGTGHVMRCLTLAEGLREKGANCRFICRAHPGKLLDLIRQRGFEAHALPAQHFVHSLHPLGEALGGGESAHVAWLGADWATDAAQTKASVGEKVVDWLIVDHYALDARWERSLRPICRRLMVIDDLADRPHDCDLLLDQNLGRSGADYADLVPAGCKILAGPKFSLLRPEFAALRPYSLAHRASPCLKRLLITMGGVDKDNATGKVLGALRDSLLPRNCHITVVMGSHAPWLKQVSDSAAKIPFATEVLVNVGDMAKLMADSDLALGAAGTTAWERCCLGLPTLIAVLAGNQLAGARALQTAGAVLLLDSTIPIARDLPAKLSRLLEPGVLIKMQQACSSITDGDGIPQLVAKLTNVQI